MKAIFVFIVFALFACNESRKNETETSVDSSQATNDESETQSPSALKQYSNNRFRNVTVQKVGENSYTIEGIGQIFEANFNWVVEDGHNELQQGFQMTDAGAPAWGKFKFSIEVEKQRPNSTLTLILFESSAKDGSRQHELPIALE